MVRVLDLRNFQRKIQRRCLILQKLSLLAFSLELEPEVVFKYSQRNFGPIQQIDFDSTFMAITSWSVLKMRQTVVPMQQIFKQVVFILLQVSLEVKSFKQVWTQLFKKSVHHLKIEMMLTFWNRLIQISNLVKVAQLV